MNLGLVTVAFDPSAIVIWAFIGLVAGFLASKVMMGHGMGLFADIAVGIVGALAGGLLAGALGVSFTVPGHPIVSEIVIAFLGAIVLLLILRLLGLGRRGWRHRY
jgi:uncharacterized membrane protein YeaQ/YmgE (transglycosylase-associated protein family)